MVLQLTNIYKTYKNGKHTQMVIQNLSVTFPKTGMVGIIGSSGSGKSTLLNIIAGMEKPNQGSLSIDRQELNFHSTYQLTEYRKRYIAFIYQYYNMIAALTIKENIKLFAAIKEVKCGDHEITVLAKQLQIVDCLLKKPSQLSGGQLQRVAILRAFLCQTPILLADEPTGALHQKQSEVVMNALAKYAKKHLVIIVSHNIPLLKQYTKQLIDVDHLEQQYDFGEEIPYQHYVCSKAYKDFKYTWIYVWRQLQHIRFKLLLIIVSQIFTVVSFSLLISARAGILFYFEEMQQIDIDKNRIVLQKNEYVDASFNKEELVALKNENVEEVVYQHNLYNGVIKKGEKTYDVNYQMLPKQYEHLIVSQGTLASHENEICISDSLANAQGLQVKDTLVYTIENQEYSFCITGIIKSGLQSNQTVYFYVNYLPTSLQEKIVDKTSVIVELKTSTDSKAYLQKIDQLKYYGYSNYLDIVDSYQALVTLGSLVATIFIVVSFVISLILLSIMLSTIFIERKKDSALLFVQGMTKGQLANLFFRESWLIGLGIGILGSVCSYIVIVLANQYHWFAFLTTIDPLFIFPSPLPGYINIIYIALCTLLACLTTHKIIKMNMVTVLKEE